MSRQDRAPRSRADDRAEWTNSRRGRIAKAIVVLGEVIGNVTATEKVDIRDNGSVDGDIIAPRVAIAEGAHFRGSVDMQKGATPAEARD